MQLCLGAVVVLTILVTGLAVLHASKVDDVATARHAINEGLVDMAAKRKLFAEQKLSGLEMVQRLRDARVGAARRVDAHIHTLFAVPYFP